MKKSKKLNSKVIISGFLIMIFIFSIVGNMMIQQEEEALDEKFMECLENDTLILVIDTSVEQYSQEWNDSERMYNMFMKYSNPDFRINLGLLDCADTRNEQNVCYLNEIYNTPAYISDHEGTMKVTGYGVMTMKQIKEMIGCE